MTFSFNVLLELPYVIFDFKFNIHYKNREVNLCDK